MKKRVFATVTVLALALSVLLAGCGDKKAGGDGDKLAGTWNCTLELADYLNEEFDGEDMGEYLHLDTFPVTLSFTFKDDATYACAVDSDAFAQAVDGVKSAVKDGVTRYAEDMIAAEGVEVSVEELFEMMGTSLDDMVESSFSEEDLADITDEYTFEGKYTAQDGKLCLSDGLEYEVDPASYFSYTLTDTTLTLESATGYTADEDVFGNLYPVTMTKAG